MHATQSINLAGLEINGELLLSRKRDINIKCSWCERNICFSFGGNNPQRYSHSGHRSSVTNPTLSYNKLYRDKYRDLLQHLGFYQ